MEETATGEIRERGEITIPKKIRSSFHLETGQEMAFIPLGKDAILLTPKRLELEEARRKIKSILRQTGKSAEEVLKSLAFGREAVFQKHYGK